MTVTVSARGFGPIRQGSVTVRPLTVLVGPNNSGKSYMSMLLYAVQSGRESFRYLGGSQRYFYPNAYLETSYLYMDAPQQADRALSEYLGKKRSDTDATFGDAPASLRAFVAETARDAITAYGHGLSTEIERCFGTPLEELARRRTEERMGFRVEIKHTLPSWSLHLTLRQSGARVQLVSPPDVDQTTTEVARRFFSRGRARRPRTSPPELLVQELRTAVLTTVMRGLRGRSFYLPAARSGILQSHRLLAGAVVSRAPLVGIEDMAIPRMSGVISDFISLLLRLEPGMSSPLDDVARFLETEILHGRVAIEGKRPAYPEISYEEGKDRFELHRTSSMVSELAPVVLLLRFIARPTDTLIIEEPESHLHPATQLKFARAVGRMLADGARVTMTTHSDYFLTELNNLIVAAGVSASRRRKLGIDSKESIAPGLAGAYLFERGCDGSGTMVRELPVDPAAGISDEGFAAVTESLYAQTVDLQPRTLL